MHRTAVNGFLINPLTRRTPGANNLRMRDGLDHATLRRLSVAASCDPRTLQDVYLGGPVRGLARQRALAALVAAGLPPRRSDGPVPVGEVLKEVLADLERAAGREG